MEFWGEILSWLTHAFGLTIVFIGVLLGFIGWFFIPLVGGISAVAAIMFGRSLYFRRPWRNSLKWLVATVTPLPLLGLFGYTMSLLIAGGSVLTGNNWYEIFPLESVFIFWSWTQSIAIGGAAAIGFASWIIYALHNNPHVNTALNIAKRHLAPATR